MNENEMGKIIQIQAIERNGNERLYALDENGKIWVIDSPMLGVASDWIDVHVAPRS